MTKTLKFALLFGIPWMIAMAIVNAIISGGLTPTILTSSLIGGAIAGISFSIAMQFAAKWLYSKITVDIRDDEKIIKEGGANHFKGKEGVGGKLVLTDRRLIFKSHKFNMQNHEANFDIVKIERAKEAKSLNILNNGLTIELVNQENYKFVINDPGDWVRTIEEQKRLIDR